jgi:hydroxyacylglutathione hydrolase
MYIEQIYTGCLAQASYYIESNGEAAVIDPIRDYLSYLSLASERSAKIKYVFETHFHADFVSGHIDLAKAAGTPIVYGPETQTGFDVHIAGDGEEFKIGKITIIALHTPGHTPESTSYLLKDENGKDHAVFTGDTLFIGDVGRPDLFDGKFSKEEMATRLYHSLNDKIKTLPDDVIVYPAHGAGSSCGKKLGPERSSTIGTQKLTNYALQPMDVQSFIHAITNGISAPPDYFAKNAHLNKSGYEDYEKVMNRGLRELDVAEFENEIMKGAVMIDSRIPDKFEDGFIKDSLNIGLNGQYAIWAATLIDLKMPILIVCEEGHEKESVLRLTRTGFDNILGVLKGGFEAWRDAGKPTDMVISIDADELALDAKFEKNIHILDVRKPDEWNEKHLKDAEHIQLQDLEEGIHDLDKNGSYYVHCAGGYRSMVAASLLKKEGIVNIKNVKGGFGKIKDTGMEMESSLAVASN